MENVLTKPVIDSEYEIGRERNKELYKMFKYLESSKKYEIYRESFLDFMCHHYTLYSKGDDEPIAKLINNFDKTYIYIEYKR